MADHLLDNVIWHALTGPQAGMGLGQSPVRRFRPEFAPFAAMPVPSAENVARLAEVLPEKAMAVLFTTVAVAPPDGLTLIAAEKLSQMTATKVAAAGDDVEIVDLAPPDVPAMLRLVALTEPGPFAARTIEMGRYLGVRAGGELVAMAGERLHAAGHTEVSAVCTHPDHRGKGYAKALVSRVARGVVARGETPFLHVRIANAAAIATYRRLGFSERRLIDLTVMQKPASL